MKKVLAILLALAMVFSMAGVVSAVGETQDITSSGQTPVTYSTEQSYTVTIPTKVAFSEGSLESANFVKATNVLLPGGALLEVTVNSLSEFNLVYGSGLTVSKIPYTVTKYDGSAVSASNNVVLQVASSVTEQSADLIFSTTEENVKMATMSGEHMDALEFTVTLKEAPVEGEEESNVIYIGNKETLLAFANDVNTNGNSYSGKTVMLTADIDLAGEGWKPIGPNADGANKFKGTFDGQGHTISNLYVETDAGYTAAGFFGALNGVAKNFVIDGATIKHISTGDPTDNGIAVVAGSLYSKGTIEDVTVKNAVVEGNRYTGGISGYTYGTVKNCKVIDSTITAVPDSASGSYNNGDKVGGIAGYWSSESVYSMTGNTVENVVLKAYRDVGGIVGTANGVTADNLKGNTVKDVTIIVDQKTNTYGDETKNAGEIVKRVTSGALEEGVNTVENVVIYENYVKYESECAIPMSSLADSTLVELAAGEYTLSGSFSSNPDVTFIGAGKEQTTINLGDTINSNGGDLVFENLKLIRQADAYTKGFYHVVSETYNNCAIEGQYFLYGKATFNDCTFTNTGDNYNLWTYGSQDTTFNNCIFNSQGKALLVYGDDGKEDVKINDCTFNDDEAFTVSKAAIEIGSDRDTDVITVTINKITVNGFAETEQKTPGDGNIGTSVWGNKNLIPNSRLNVVIDGLDVY